MIPLWQSCLAAAMAMSSAAAHAQAGMGAAERQGLHQRQLEESLRLQMQQASPPRSTLSPADARRLDELQLRQRAQQQQLSSEQLHLERQRALRPGDSGLRMRERLLEQESVLQLQRFQLEQQELLRSARPPPLQRPLPGGTLQR